MNNSTILKKLNEIAIITETDLSGKIVRVNHRFEDISGYKEEELVGKDHNILNSGHHSDEFFKDLWKTIASGKTWHGEILNRKKNGDLYWVDSYIFATYDDQNVMSGYLSIRYDITEKIRMKEAEMAKHRLITIGETAAQILHDIKSPLTVIDYYLREIHQNIEQKLDTEKMRLEEKVTKIEKASHRITEIVKSMQVLTHGSYEVQSVNLVDELEAAKEYLAAKLQGREIMFQVFYKEDKDSYTIRGNSTQVQQVLINLLNNSIDAIADKEAPWVRVELTSKKNKIELSVIDSGPGIDLKIRNKIFDSMFSTKKLYNGTGLGLGICKKIVESYGGSIKVNEDYPHTRFDVELPKLN